MSSNDSAASMSRPRLRIGVQRRAVHPETAASISSASSRGVSTPAASSVSAAFRERVAQGEVALRQRAAPAASSGRLGLELAAALVRGERVGELVQLALEHALEVVRRELDPVVGDPALGKL